MFDHVLHFCDTIECDQSTRAMYHFLCKMPDVLILSPFKTGTWAVYNACLNAGFSVVRSHGIERPKDVKYIITMVRDWPAQCVSAFFQDNFRKEYPYYVGTQDEIAMMPPNKLFQVFAKQEWHTFSHVDFKHCWGILEKEYGVHLEKRAPQVRAENGYKVLVLRVEDARNSKRLCKFLGKRVVLRRVHCRTDKAYVRFKKRCMKRVRKVLRPYVKDFTIPNE